MQSQQIPFIATSTRGAPAIRLLLISLLCLLYTTPHLYAEPADWYQWQSRLTEKIICKQTDPGAGWQKHDGPFQDAGCRQRKSLHSSNKFSP